MQTPSASDPSFKSFLEKLQEQNSRGFVTQLVQLKADRENVGKDNDKREEQLGEVISSLNEVRTAVTGIKLDIDLTPLVNIGENQTKLLEELSKENSLTRKLTEGSVEYDKEAAQYRNTSGRDIESKVSGKMSKDGGFIDFETARDTLSGQGKRAKEDNAFSLKPINYTPGKAAAAAVGGKEKPAAKEEVLDKPVFKGFLEEIKSGFKFFMTDGLSQVPGYGPFQEPSKDVEKKEREAKVSSPRQENPEADNIASTGEIEADAAKSDLEISKQMLDTTKAQLVELKAIREALTPDTPKDLVEKKSTPTATTEASDGAGGGSILGDLASGAIDLMSGGKKTTEKVAGKAAGLGSKILGGAQALGGKAVGFANSGAGKLLGSVAAVGLGAYTAYEGVTAAEDSKQAKMEVVQAKVASGEIKPEEAAAARKEIGNTATVEKSGAVGEGTGMAAGAIAGAKLGATVGTFFGGPIGTAVGGLAGGALGAFAGSKAGKVVGEYGGKAINSVERFFGGEEKDPGKATAVAPMETVDGKKVNKEAGPNWKAALQDYKSSTPVDGLESQYPGIKAKFIELANKSTPRTDNRQSIETHEEGLKTKALSELTGGKSTASAKLGSVTPTEAAADPKPSEAKLSEAKSVTPVDGRSAMVKQREESRRTTFGTLYEDTPSVMKKADNLSDQATKLGIDPNKATGTFEGGVLTKITDKVSGKEHNIEVSEKDKGSVAAAREMRAANENSGRLAAAASAKSGIDVIKTSTENADMGREASKSGSNNTVVSNNVSSNNTTKIVPMKASPRPEYTGSSLDRYTNRITVY